MNIRAVKTRVFQEDESLLRFVYTHVPSLSDSDVLVITSKIVSLAEGRYIHEWDDASRSSLITKESDEVLGTTYPPLTRSKGMYAAAAGIDTSNGNGALILSPHNAWKVARTLHRALMSHYTIRKLGIIITDSMPLPGRKGVVSMALSCAGFVPIREYKGTKDIFGRVFEYSSANCADALASAAGVVMGEGSEQHPLAIITGAPIVFQSKQVKNTEMLVNMSDDIYAPLFNKKIKLRKKINE